MTGLSSLPSSLCLSCLRRIAGINGPQPFSSLQKQIRGKKTSAKKPGTINVKLSIDMKGYGRKGSITPVAPGRMRNSWYPRQKAEYLSTMQGVGLKPQKIVAERDFNFGLHNEKLVSSVTKREKELQRRSGKPAEDKTQLLPPQRAFEIIEALLPSHLIFYRTPIDPEQETAIHIVNRPQRAASSAAADLAAASQPTSYPGGRRQLPLSKSQLTYIFGSVSTADVADSMRAVLAESLEGARIVIRPEDVEFSVRDLNANGIEEGRLKALGEYRVEVKVKGGAIEKIVRRIASVRPLLP